MSYHVFSAQSFPHQPTDEAGWTPEYIEMDGFRVTPVLAGEWKELERNYRAVTPYKEQKTVIMGRTWNDADFIGNQISFSDVDFAAWINANYGPIGVVAIPEHVFSDDKKRKAAEQEARNRNIEYRKKTLEEFEQQLHERKITGKGRAKPTKYEEECYDILGWPKPYSLDALKAERMPGAVAAQQIADAILESQHRANTQAQEAFSGGKK